MPIDPIASNRVLADPALVERRKVNATLNAADRNTFFGAAQQGYTDYPRLDQAQAV